MDYNNKDIITYFVMKEKDNKIEPVKILKFTSENNFEMKFKHFIKHMFMNDLQTITINTLDKKVEDYLTNYLFKNSKHDAGRISIKFENNPENLIEKKTYMPDSIVRDSIESIDSLPVMHVYHKSYNNCIEQKIPLLRLKVEYTIDKNAQEKIDGITTKNTNKKNTIGNLKYEKDSTNEKINTYNTIKTAYNTIKDYSSRVFSYFSKPSNKSVSKGVARIKDKIMIYLSKFDSWCQKKINISPIDKKVRKKAESLIEAIHNMGYPEQQYI